MNEKICLPIETFVEMMMRHHNSKEISGDGLEHYFWVNLSDDYEVGAHNITDLRNKVRTYLQNLSAENPNV
ncbi:MAG: hypothetical protein WCG45_05820 [bacterium]